MDKKEIVAVDILMSDNFTQNVIKKIQKRETKPRSFIEIDRKIFIKVYACAAVIIISILCSGVFDAICSSAENINTKVTSAFGEINKTDINNIFKGGK